MAKRVVLKSLSTGLSGLYPEFHLGLDPDLVLDTGDLDCGCWPEDEIKVGDDLISEEQEVLPTPDKDEENTDG